VSDRPSALLLVNPAARRVRAGYDYERPVRYLRARGWEATLCVPLSPADATAQARTAAARGTTIVLALGGDGTQRDVAEGLIGSNTALAPLPGGTVNILCRELGLPRRLRAALDAHIEGQPTRMDVGLANGRPFLLMASAGWDAAVTASVNPAFKRRAGDIAYIARFLRMAPRLRTTEMRWRSGLMLHERHIAVMVISNTRLYGGRIRPSPGAYANDGLLDVVALCPSGPRSVVSTVARAARSRLSAAPDVEVDCAPALAIETPDIPYQLDGDYAGLTPVAFSVGHLALNVRVPAGALPEILRD
jgi:YegS/Rv2252/BmrU family lipid kinase